MESHEAPSRSWMPRWVAYLLGLLVPPLAMGGMMMLPYEIDPGAFPSGLPKVYLWLCILLPGLLLNGILTLASIRERTALRFVPRLMTLLALTAVGMMGYVVVLLATSSGGLKPGG